MEASNISLPLKYRRYIVMPTPDISRWIFVWLIPFTHTQNKRTLAISYMCTAAGAGCRPVSTVPQTHLHAYSPSVSYSNTTETPASVNIQIHVLFTQNTPSNFPNHRNHPGDPTTTCETAHICTPFTQTHKTLMQGTNTHVAPPPYRNFAFCLCESPAQHNDAAHHPRKTNANHWRRRSQRLPWRWWSSVHKFMLIFV